MFIKLLFLTNIMGLILMLGIHNIRLLINTNKVLIRQLSLSISIITFYICIY
ncbi:hypothetical protein GCM10009504_47620 [Pseudomonas laurentiana]|nr:hypothetical protein GCM10009504_47620 [Pseudomonas laurentiana]